MSRPIIPLLAVTVAVAVAGAVLLARKERPAAAPAPSISSASTPRAPLEWASPSDRELNVASIFLAARKSGLGAALDTLQAVAARDSNVFADGHALAHGIGRFVMARNGADPSALMQCRPVFEAGCYHGVLEGYLASVAKVDATKLTSMCGSLIREGESPLPAHECAHGLGHGLLERFSYDLAAALGACDAFAVEPLRGECHDGVFMQNTVRGLGLTPAGSTTTAASEHHHGAMPATSDSTHAVGPFRASDLAFPCDSVGAAYQPSCWAYQPIALIQLLGLDVEKTLRGCDLAPDAAKSRCWAGLGKQATGWFNENNDRVIAMCRSATKGFTDSCFAGAVETKIDANWTPDGALAFCRKVPKASKAACYEIVGERMALVRGKESAVRADCALAEPEYVDACLRGGRRT